MRTTTSMLASGLAIAVFAVSAQAQNMTPIGPGAAGSPHVKAEWTIGGAHIAITYGRPYLKGRAESNMMPVGQPWRTGADEATVLTSDKSLTFGTITLPAGSYTINTQPGDKQWMLLLGTLKSAGQWGVPYVSALELGRAPMSLGRAALVEQVTYSIDSTAGGATLRIEWGTVSVSTRFTIGS